MAIDLSKGQRVSLSKKLSSFKIGLGWDPNNSNSGDFDLDVSIFVIGENGKLIRDEYFIFYNNRFSPDGAIELSEDDRTGLSSDGDDEEVKIELAKLDQQVKEMVFVVSIHEATARKQNFGQVRNAYIRMIDESDDSEVLNYELDEDFSVETSVEFARIYRRGDDWKFAALGDAYQEDLNYFVSKYQ